MMATLCDGCGSDFSLSYALNYHKGGLIIQCHYEVRDTLGDLAAWAYRDVTCESVVQEGA